MTQQTSIQSLSLNGQTCTPAQKIMTGAVSGLMGGVVFGVMMAMLNMIGMISALVGSTSNAVGWVLHLSISMFIGVSFTLLFQDRLRTLARGLTFGVSYGLFWWILGALMLMPAKLKMPLFHFSTSTWQSLMGHMVFGAVLGACVILIPRSMHK